MRSPSGDTGIGEAPAKRKVGRPTKCTPEITAQIADAIADGLNDQFVCDLVRIDVQTLCDWRNTRPEFAHAIKSEEAARLQKRLRRIQAGEDGWQGTAWFVERKYPREWSRPELQINQQFNIVNQIKDEPVPELELIRMLQVRNEIEAEVAA